MLKGGDGGAAVVPGKPKESLLRRRDSHTDRDLKMPPTGKLPEREIAALDEVDRSSARRGRTKLTLAAPDAIASAAAKHWAFQPVKRPPRSRKSRIRNTQSQSDRRLRARRKLE